MEMTLYIYQTFLFKLTKRLKLLGLGVTKLVLPPTPNPRPWPCAPAHHFLSDTPFNFWP